MASPTVILGNRTLFILRGFCERRRLPRFVDRGQVSWELLPASDQLRQAAEDNPEAVAFGFMRGRWHAAA
jgi:hypothetical protein